MVQQPKPKDFKTLDRIDDLIEEDELEAALDASMAFTRKRPKILESWQQLSEIAHAIGSEYHLWVAMRQLSQLDRHEDNYLYNMAIVAIRNDYPFMARQIVADYLKRFPNGIYSKQINEMKETLDQAIQALIDDGEVPTDVNIDDMSLLETGSFLAAHGDYAEGRRFSLRAAKKLPDNPAPLNNVCLSYLVEGDLMKALQTADEVLSTHPDNIHARSNKVQALVKLGRPDEARTILDSLHQETLARTEYQAKTMEACAYAHEHQMVIGLYERADLKSDSSPFVGMMHQLGGTAYAFLGHPKKASLAWKQALEINPDNEIVLENKRMLHLHGPWYFPLGNWMASPWLASLLKVLDRSVKRGETNQRRHIEKLFSKTPGFEATASLMFERGDPDGLEMALNFSENYPLPGLVDFALGQRGTDDDRARAARIAVDHGLLDRSKPVPLVINGEVQEISLMNFEIYTEPEEDDFYLSEAAQAHLEAAHEAFLEGDAEASLQEAEKGLAIAPDGVALLNHKANALHMLDRHKEADAVNRQLAADHPDYLFARVAMAVLCIREGKLDEANEWLMPLLRRERFHISEFRGLAMAYIQYWQAKGEFAGAQQWIQMLDNVDPDSVPEQWREKAGLMDLLSKLKDMK